MLGVPRPFFPLSRSASALFIGETSRMFSFLANFSIPIPVLRNVIWVRFVYLKGRYVQLGVRFSLYVKNTNNWKYSFEISRPIFHISLIFYHHVIYNIDFVLHWAFYIKVRTGNFNLPAEPSGKLFIRVYYFNLMKVHRQGP